MKYLEIDDLRQYQSKMKGFHMPFYLHDKATRVEDDDIGHNYKVKNKKLPFSDVKKIVADIRDKRERDRMQKEMAVNEKYLRKMKYI